MTAAAGAGGLLAWRVALAGYALALVVGTHLPRSTVSHWTPDDILGLDKLAHFSAYLGLGALAASVWHARRPATFFGALPGLCGLAAFALVDEFSQGWPGLGREPDPLDFLADLVGGGMGWAAALWLRAMVRRRG